MTKQEMKKFVLVKVRSKMHKVYVSDLKAIIMRRRASNRPRVPAFDEKPHNNNIDVETDASICSDELLPEALMGAWFLLMPNRVCKSCRITTSNHLSLRFSHMRPMRPLLVHRSIMIRKFCEINPFSWAVSSRRSIGSPSTRWSVLLLLLGTTESKLCLRRNRARTWSPYPSIFPSSCISGGGLC